MTTAPTKKYSLLTITEKTNRAGAAGTWVQGTCGGASFTALVFPARATNPAFEIRPGCRISKLEVRQEGRVIANFDRGWDMAPGEDAWDCVALLVAALADVVFGPEHAKH